MLRIIHLLEGCTVQFSGRSVSLAIVVIAIISSFIGLSISSTGLPSSLGRPSSWWFARTIWIDMPLLATTITDHYRLFAFPLEMPWNSTIVTNNIPSRIGLISTTALVIVIVIVIFVVAIVPVPRFELQVGFRFACLNSLGFFLGSLPPILLDILIIIFKGNGCIQQ